MNGSEYFQNSPGILNYLVLFPKWKQSSIVLFVIPKYCPVCCTYILYNGFQFHHLVFVPPPAFPGNWYALLKCCQKSNLNVFVCLVTSNFCFYAGFCSMHMHSWALIKHHLKRFLMQLPIWPRSILSVSSKSIHFTKIKLTRMFVIFFKGCTCLHLEKHLKKPSWCDCMYGCKYSVGVFCQCLGTLVLL